MQGLLTPMANSEHLEGDLSDLASTCTQCGSSPDGEELPVDP